MNRLKELRKNKNITQLELAKHLNIAESTYCCYEKGINEPNIETLIKLANYYNVSVDYLIGHNFYNEIGYLTETQKSFVQAFLSLNKDNQLNATIYVAGLLANQ